MAQITTGIRSILSSPAIYELFHRVIGSEDAQRDFVKRYVRAAPGDAVLDIGCGPATVLADLPEVSYVGFDPSAAYIEAATKRYGSRGRFLVGGIDDIDAATLGRFDVVLAKGVLHHIEDDQAIKVFETARSVLADGGRLVTVDGCYVEGQSRAARFLISRDRGQNVRSLEGFRALAEKVFPSVECHVRHDRLRVPYTHLIMVCRAA